MNTEQKQLRFISGPDGGVILDIGAGLISTLNPTGSFIWKRLQAGEPIQVITESLAVETGALAADIEGDVDQFVNELKERGLLPL